MELWTVMWHRLTTVDAWYLSRATGIVAYLLLFASTVLGLSMSTKLLHTRPWAGLAGTLHRFTSAMATYLALVHGVILRYDSFISFHWKDLAIPFVSDYRPVVLGLGIVGFYLTVMVTLTTETRSLFSARVWQILHSFAFIGYGLVLAHAVWLGTDTSLPWVWSMYLGTGGIVVALILYRIIQSTRRTEEVSPAHAHSAGRG